MSLRQSSAVSAARVAANRANAKKSTGPRTEAGKARTRLNALRHGRYAAPATVRQAMTALGEEPEEFARLYQGLVEAYAPADPLWAKQVEDLAKLYWRRARLERAREGMLRRRRQAFEAAQETDRRAIAEATFPPTQEDLVEFAYPSAPKNPVARGRFKLSYLGLVLERAKQRRFTERLAWIFKQVCPPGSSWQADRIAKLLGGFAPDCRFVAQPEESEYPKLLELLEDQLARARQDLQEAEARAPAISASERDACLLPAGDQWALILREERALDRAIDRKVRILMDLMRRRRAQEDWEPSKEEAGSLTDTSPNASDPTEIRRLADSNFNLAE